jgi:hypothetical protein
MPSTIDPALKWWYRPPTHFAMKPAKWMGHKAGISRSWYLWFGSINAGDKREKSA